MDNLVSYKAPLLKNMSENDAHLLNKFYAQQQRLMSLDQDRWSYFIDQKNATTVTLQHASYSPALLLIISQT